MNPTVLPVGRSVGICRRAWNTWNGQRQQNLPLDCLFHLAELAAALQSACAVGGIGSTVLMQSVLQKEPLKLPPSCIICWISWMGSKTWANGVL